MKTLVTGSAGHLGEALMRTLRQAGRDVLGIDLKPSPFTDRVGSIRDRAFVRECMVDADQVIHTATLHKPHIATHGYQDFVDTNITGTLNLLEQAASRKVGAFVFTSTTSVFGSALIPPIGEPAAWITEEVVPIPKNIYGVSKLAAEHLCELFAKRHRLPVVVLRTSRFFPEADDDSQMRSAFAELYAARGWRLFERIDRVYDNTCARGALGWQPRYGFQYVLDSLRTGSDIRSSLAREIGIKGYHDTVFADGPYPVM